MNTLETLVAARKLIEKPENWTQAVFARDAEGRSVHVYSDSAVCFCADGALLKTTLGVTPYYPKALNALRSACYGSVIVFNDSGSHTAVLAAFNKAIEDAKGRAS